MNMKLIKMIMKMVMKMKLMKMIMKMIMKMKLAKMIKKMKLNRSYILVSQSFAETKSKTTRKSSPCLSEAKRHS